MAKGRDKITAAAEMLVLTGFAGAAGSAIDRLMEGAKPSTVLSSWAEEHQLTQDEAVVVLYFAGLVLSKREGTSGA